MTEVGYDTQTPDVMVILTGLGSEIFCLAYIEMN